MAAPSIGRLTPPSSQALNQPDPSYHGAVWVEAVKPLGPIAYIIKARVTLLRDIGTALEPVQCLPVHPRPGDPALVHSAPTQRQCPSGGRPSGQASQGDQGHPPLAADRRVPPPGRGHSLKGGFGGLVGFELAEALEAGRRFIDGLELFYHVANIGDARSLAIDPASTTHSQLLPPEDHDCAPASPTAMSACRWASSISTTSWPISIAGLQLPETAKFFGAPQSRPLLPEDNTNRSLTCHTRLLRLKTVAAPAGAAFTVPSSKPSAIRLSCAWTSSRRKRASKANLLAKLEFFNPIASVKDRIGVSAMSREASSPDKTILIEPTSGNTGIALAFVAAQKWVSPHPDHARNHVNRAPQAAHASRCQHIVSLTGTGSATRSRHHSRMPGLLQSRPSPRSSSASNFRS